MDESRTSRNQSPEAAAPLPPPANESRRTGRRAFLADVGVKAAYITPVLLTLTAAPAMASAFAASCRPIGQPCIRNASCCTSNCDVGGTNLCVP